MSSAGVADMAALEQRFEERVLGLAAAAGRAYIVWQDVLDNGVQVIASSFVRDHTAAMFSTALCGNRV